MLGLMILCTLAPQEGTTDAAVARAALLLASGALPSPEEIRVYDFVNRHRHDLPIPAEGVGLDVRLLRPALPGRTVTTVLQIGFATPRPEREALRPLNVALVIDKSGSMAAEGKLEYVKDALNRFVGALTERDRLAIVVYDSEARVLVRSTPVSRPDTIQTLIRNLAPGGSTNLHEGLMLGYREVERNLDPARANKVILLSDGMANVGVTDREGILSDSRAQNDKGIDVTTIGIGREFDDCLMEGLARAGRGDYHYLDSAEEITRIFETELAALFGRVARQVRVRLALGPGVALRTVYGYEFALEESAVVFPLLDMGYRLTQVLPIEIEVAEDAPVDRLAVVTLEYVDGITGEAVTVEQVLTARRQAAEEPEEAADADVIKNFTIARLADALHEAARLEQEHKPGLAADLLSQALRRVETLYGPTGEGTDPDLRRVLDLVVRAEGILRGRDVR